MCGETQLYNTKPRYRILTP